MKIHKQENNLIFPLPSSLFARNICSIFCISNLFIKGLFFLTGWDISTGNQKLFGILRSCEFCLSFPECSVELSFNLKEQNCFRIVFQHSRTPRRQEAITLKKHRSLPVSTESTRKKVYSGFIIALYLGHSLVSGVMGGAGEIIL